MKPVLTAMAWVEAAAGVGLLASPQWAASILLGAQLDSPAGVVAARIAGAALLALGLACWRARVDSTGPTASAIVLAMLVYNVVAVALLAHGWISLGLHGIGLWPAVTLHAALAAWCVACLVGRSVTPPNNPERRSK